MIYLDSSALMKLVRREDETDSLVDWLDTWPEHPVVTSELGRVEVLRAARRMSSQALAEAHAVIGDMDLIPIGRSVQGIAADIEEPVLRTLDALHLASAMLLGEDLTAFVAYDHRLVTAARGVGVEVVVP